MSEAQFDYAAAIAAEAEHTPDMNDVTSGGARVILDEGHYLGAICRYIDIGEHEDEYNGKVTGVFPKVRFGVAVFNPDEDGNLDPDPVLVTPFPMTIKRNEKAGAYKAFRALNYQNDPKITHMAQFFLKPRFFKVTKNTSKDGKREYNGIDWTQTMPAVDPMTKRQYPLPDIPDELKVLFLWNNPDKSQWDKLHIEGERDDGTSKNFIQDEIANALNFHGSAVDLMLRGGGEPLPEPDEEVEEQEAPKPKVKPKASKSKATAAAPKLPKVPKMPALPEDDDIPF